MREVYWMCPVGEDPDDPEVWERSSNDSIEVLRRPKSVLFRIDTNAGWVKRCCLHFVSYSKRSLCKPGKYVRCPDCKRFILRPDAF